jgi:plastocyanin
MLDRKLLPAAAIGGFLALAFGPASVLGQEGDVTATQEPPRKYARVLVKDNYFEPRSTEILVGGEVKWRWQGENRHSIRFTKVPAGAARKGAGLRTRGKWKRKFQRRGVYRYVCTAFSGMRGSVTVRKKEPPPPEL